MTCEMAHFLKAIIRVLTKNKELHKMKKRIIVSLLIIIALGGMVMAYCKSPSTDDLREGDVVFQISKSRQSKYVIFSSSSLWSHCGVIIEKSDGLYVLEAASTVKLTPYKKWQSKGRGGIVKARRYTDKPVKIKYSKYLGKPYDLAFRFNNDAWYCSELVYDIYKNQLGIELRTPRPVSSYNLTGLDKILQKRGIKKTQLVVAPSDLYDVGKGI